ncbi:3'(2'),5'-bisphosphate nucleotidase CysQ [Blastococcus sp. BMG 814]|uniref:3'(2'),5-bisphosphonucleoside 3'(2')-phosphohydrolase n=1 Tax=Blastococcus carthaginiensis TaxID=3050034 RepID=A0ABT9IDZ0_9ACTN|nr:3'(2'),5'-bisphosphate nucleotidase CysQ [Blastococcus carthaginiensis]MDP5183803.1 3'(2'),5'-bisphosphate nucleotidase CysQ [Blastococcus carthaginiensis]
MPPQPQPPIRDLDREGLSDVDLAVELAGTAGRALLELRSGVGDLPADEVKKRGDAAAQQVLAAGLAVARPGDAVLSEEAVDDATRLDASRVWIIDPLDGTREYSEGRSDWAVHVALWEAGSLVAGAVALPGLGTVLATDPAAVAPSRDAAAPWRMAVSRSRPPAIATGVAQALGADLVAMGSAGFKVAAVVRGEADLYVHGGGQYEWDSAAPVAVAVAAGLHASRLDGSPLRYNQPDPYLPDLVVCRPEMAERVLTEIERVQRDVQ